MYANHALYNALKVNVGKVIIAMLVQNAVQIFNFYNKEHVLILNIALKVFDFDFIFK